MADGGTGDRGVGDATIHRPDAAELAAALDAIPARVFLLDGRHRIRWTNAAGAAYFGAPPERLVGRAIPDLIGAEEFACNRAEREAAIAGEARRWSGWAPQPDGGARHFQRHYLPHAGPDGPGYLVVAEDDTERAAAEAQARRSDAVLREALASLRFGVGIEDAEGRIVQCNDPYAAVYGAPADSLVGLGFDARMAVLAPRIEEIDGEAVADAAAALARTTALRAAGVAQTELATRDGRRFLNRSAPVDGGGRVVIYDDVSDRRRAEAALRESWETVTRALEACPVPVSMSRAADAALLYCNPAAEALLGYEPGGWRGRTITELWRDPGRHALAVEALRRDGRLDDVESRFLAADGREKVLSFSSRIARLRDETVFVSAAVDLTERLRAEAALRDSWEMVTRVMEVCPVPIAMTRAATGEIIYANPALERVLGFDPGAAETRPAHRSWRDPAEHAAAAAELRRTGRIDGREVCFVRPDGAEVWLAISARAASFRGEEVFVTCAVDLTAQRAQEAELARQREIAHQAEKLSALGELLAGVSHELNNPLTVIVGEAAILRETADTAWVRARAERLAGAADRCARIVRSFLALARQGPARRESVDLAAVARAAAELAAPEIAAAGAALALDLDPAIPPTLGDLDQLRQVALNLLVNAAHAVAEAPGPRRVTLTVSADPAAGRLRLTVGDSGPGVPSAIAGRIFEPLFTTKPVGRGSGLGLALCHRLVSAHGGELSLLNPGQPGAVFEVALPTAEPARADRAAPAPRPSGLSVLVVDDDAEVGRTAADLLSMDGHAVTLAASAREGLALAAARPFDLVVTDVRMPEMDGLEFWRRLGAQAPSLAARVAFATGDLLSPDVAAALRATGQPVLEKPFLPGDLRDIVAVARRR